VKANGETVFSATLTVTNEFGEVRILAFVATKSHAQFESALAKMKESLTLYGHKQPKIFYTDNPAADKNFLERLFPSLTENVVPVENHVGLKAVTRPQDVHIYVQSSASGIESVLAKITVDLDMENDKAHIVVGFDAEWNVDLTYGGAPQPTAIIQIAYKKRIDIFQISQFKGKLPIALQNFLANPQILKAGRNVTQDLKRLQKECKYPVSFIGAVELATMAKQKGFISDARIGLADLCAKVLHAKLDKTSPVRLDSKWDAIQLSAEQIEYAALDAWVSLEIYHRLAQTIPSSSTPGTAVSVVHEDGNVIAHGVVSLNASKSPCNGINHTPNRVRVTIQDVLVPGAIIRFHNASLASFGCPPFDILVKQTRVQPHAVSLTPDSPSESHLLPPQLLSDIGALDPELLEFLSQPVPPDEDWTEDVDEPLDIDEAFDGNVSNAETDRLSLEEGLALLREIDSNPTAWPAAIRSRVIMDVWHAMARIKVSKQHGCCRPFAQALRDAMFIPDQEDKRRVSEYLTDIGSSWDEVLHTNARWLWKHCKRVIPPPELLYPLVKEVYTIYGPLLDAKTQKPLFNSRAWKDASNVLKAVKAGLLSDPPGVPLYFQIGVDKKHGGLPLYHCARGTNNAEGGVHHSGRRHLPISGVSARHASTRLKDFVLMHNLLVRLNTINDGNS